MVTNNIMGQMRPDALNVDEQTKRMRTWQESENGEISEHPQTEGYDPTMPSGKEDGFEGYG